MSGIFQNIDPPPPSPPGEYVPPAFGAGGGHTSWVDRGIGLLQYNLSTLSVSAGSAEEEAGEHGEAEQNPHCGETTAPTQTKESGICSPVDRSTCELHFQLSVPCGLFFHLFSKRKCHNAVPMLQTNMQKEL